MSVDNQFILNLFHPYKLDGEKPYPKEAIKSIIDDALSEDAELTAITVQTVSKTGTYKNVKYLTDAKTNYMGLSDIEMSDCGDNTLKMNLDRALSIQQLQFHVDTFMDTLLKNELNKDYLILSSMSDDA